MKTRFKLLLIPIFASLFLMSCSKDDDAVATLRERATIKTGETYRFYVGDYLESTTYQITKQPSYAKQSEFQKETESKKLYYTYTPKDDFVGQEQLTIFTKGLKTAKAKHYFNLFITVEK